MANTNAPNGIIPFSHGGQPTTRSYTIAADYATVLAKGDPVELTGTGQNIQLAAAGNLDSLGVFMGLQYVDSEGNQRFSKVWPAPSGATEIKALVAEARAYDQFIVQCDTLAEGDVGALVDWATDTANTLFGQSRAYADLTTGTSTSGMALRIEGLAPLPNNEYGSYAKAVVSFASSYFNAATGGV